MIKSKTSSNGTNQYYDRPDSVDYKSDFRNSDAFNQYNIQASTDKDNFSHKNRRSRKARRFNNEDNSNSEDLDNMQKKNSLQEFEQLEKSVENADEYQVISRKSWNKPKSHIKGRGNSVTDSNTKFESNKSKSETPAERQRIAKERQELKKMREKHDADILTLEKQK